MLKKTAVFLLCALLCASFAACGAADNTPSVSEPSEPSETSPGESIPDEPSEPADLPAGSEDESVSADESVSEEESVPAEEHTVEDILTAIELAYGDDYPPDGEIPQEMLESQYGLTADMYLDAKGEMTMISVYVNQVLVVRAAPGRADDVENALNESRDRMIADTLQYPVNIPKINASKVARNGDYVAFLLIAAPNDELTDIESAETGAYYENQVQIAVNAFHGMFQPA